MLGEIVAAALNVSAMTWRTSPAATEMETVVLRWIQELVGIPQPAANEMVGAYSAFYRPLLPDRNSGMPGSTESVRASILG